MNKLILKSTWLGLAALSAQAFGAVSFGATTNLATPQRPDGVVAGGWNSDLFFDLAVTTDTPDKLTVMFGNASGLGAPINIFFPNGSGPGEMAAADADGDGDTDIMVLLKNFNQVVHLVNPGNGQFTLGPTFAVGNEPVAIAVGQFNTDGRPDFAVVNRSGNSVTILNSALGGYAAATVAVGNDPRSVAAGDWNGDGRTDLAVTNHDDRTISLLTNNNGAFSGAGLLSTTANLRPDGIAAGDLDGDGDMDLASGLSGNGLNFVGLYRNNSGLFLGPTNFGSGGVNPGNIALKDLDCDGDLDVTVSNQDSNQVGVLQNNGAFAFGAAMSLASGTRPGAIAFGDTDHDGDLDVAVTARDGAVTSLFNNTSCTPMAVPTAFELLLGSFFGGAPLDITVSDNQRLSLFVDPNLNLIQWGVSATSPTQTPSALTLRYEGRVSDPNQAVGVTMLNVLTNQWQTVGVIAGSFNEGVTQVNIANPSRFVGASGLMRARFLTASSVEVDSVDGFNVDIDQIGWIVTP